MSKLNIISETKTIDIDSINKPTMSSREIAELTGKQHNNVLADIRKMLNELSLSTAEFSAMYKADNGQEYECFNLPKRECLVLISGYSTQFRAKIIDRWIELESNPLRSLFEKIQIVDNTVKMNGSIWGKAGNEQKKNKAIVLAYNEVLKNYIHQELELFLSQKES